MSSSIQFQGQPRQPPQQQLQQQQPQTYGIPPICEVHSHPNQQRLSYVCITPMCRSRGLICEICADELHADHNVLALPIFLNQFSDAVKLSNAVPQLVKEMNSLTNVTNELNSYFESLQTTLLDLLRSAKQKVLTNLECDIAFTQNVLDVEQTVGETLESAISSPTSENIQSLLARVGLDSSGQRCEVVSFREENLRLISMMMRKSKNIFYNITNETPKFAKDLYMYFKQIDSALEAYDKKQQNLIQNPNLLDRSVSASPRTFSPRPTFAPKQQIEVSPVRSTNGSFSNSNSNYFTKQPSQQLALANLGIGGVGENNRDVSPRIPNNPSPRVQGNQTKSITPTSDNPIRIQDGILAALNSISIDEQQQSNRQQQQTKPQNQSSQPNLSTDIEFAGSFRQSADSATFPETVNQIQQNPVNPERRQNYQPQPSNPKKIFAQTNSQSSSRYASQSGDPQKQFQQQYQTQQNQPEKGQKVPQLTQNFSMPSESGVLRTGFQQGTQNEYVRSSSGGAALSTIESIEPDFGSVQNAGSTTNRDRIGIDVFNDSNQFTDKKPQVQAFNINAETTNTNKKNSNMSSQQIINQQQGNQMAQSKSTSPKGAVGLNNKSYNNNSQSSLNNNSPSGVNYINPFFQSSKRDLNLSQSNISERQSYSEFLIEHENTITSLELCGSDKIATGSADNTIKIWERQTKQLINQLEGHSSSVNALKYHEGSRTLASGGGEDQTVIIWRYTPQLSKVHIMKGHQGEVKCLCFQNDRILVSSAADATIIIWDIEQGVGKKRISSADGDIDSLIVVNKMIMTVCDVYVQFWELSSHKLLKKVEAHDGRVNMINSIHRRKYTGDLIVTCSDDGAIYIWDGDNKYEEVDKVEEDPTEWVIKAFDYNVHYDLLVFICNSVRQNISKVMLYSLETKARPQLIKEIPAHAHAIKTWHRHIYVASKANSLSCLEILKKHLPLSVAE